MSTSNPLAIELTAERRDRLMKALRHDDPLYLDNEGFARVWDAMQRLPDGTMLPYEIPNGTDGETDAEIVSLALDYYGVA